MSKIKKAANSGLLYIIVFAAGAILAVTIMPTKIEKVTETIIKEVEVEVDRKGDRDEATVADTETSKKEKTTERKVEYPDGTTVTETVTESESEQIARIEREIKESYEERIRQKEKEVAELKSKTVTNPKKLHLLVGINGDRDLGASLQYQLVGPINVGTMVTFDDGFNAFVGLGISF